MTQSAPSLGLNTGVLHAMVEQWPGAVLLLDARGRLQWCNEVALRLSGASGDDLHGLSFEELRMPWQLSAAHFAAACSGVPLELDNGPDQFGAGEAGVHHWQVRLRRLDLPENAMALLCVAELRGAAPLGVQGDREQSFDAAQAGTWRWNISADEASVDEAWCRHHQLDPCIGVHHTARWSSQIHPDDSTDYRRRLQELRSGGNSYFEAEYRILTRDHRWLWILQRGRVVARDSAGAPIRVIGICLDIDQRKREETSSKANESRLATALWGARAAFWQWHLPTDVRTMSPLWYAMTRYTREQWDSVRNPWLSRVHTEDSPAVHAALGRYLESSTDSLEYEYRLVSATGEWRWMLDRARAVEWDLEGKPSVIMGVSLDIDAQKRSEIALRASEARLQTAVWGARMGLKEIDFEHDAARWVDQWCEEYGVDPCEGAGHRLRWESLIHPADLEGVRQRFESHLSGKLDFYDSEFRIMTKGGVWRWIFERARVIERDEAGRARRLISVCMDVDARRQEQPQHHFTQPWLETALASARGAMWHWQIEPLEITLTDTYYRLLGVEPLPGRAAADFLLEHIHAEDLDRVRALARDLATGRSPSYEAEYRMRCADGRWIWVLDRGHVMTRGADGLPTVLCGFALDITAQRAERELLRDSEERFRYATLAARGLIYDVDYLTGLAQRFGTEALLGYEPSEILPTREGWISLMHADDRIAFEAARPLNQVQALTSELEYRLRHKAGHWVLVRDRGIAVTSPQGRPVRRIGFVEEIGSTAGGVCSNTALHAESTPFPVKAAGTG